MKTLKIGDRIKTNFGAESVEQKGIITAVEVADRFVSYDVDFTEPYVESLSIFSEHAIKIEGGADE